MNLLHFRLALVAFGILLLTAACSLSTEESASAPTASTIQTLPPLGVTLAAPSATGQPPFTVTPDWTATPVNCAVRADWPTYTVASGDTLSSIARQFNTTTNPLVVANCLTDPNLLSVGQVLRVPSTLSDSNFTTNGINGVEVLAFTASPTVVNPGESITLTWNTRGAARVNLTLETGYIDSDGRLAPWTWRRTDLPTQGSIVTDPIPSLPGMSGGTIRLAAFDGDDNNNPTGIPGGEGISDAVAHTEIEILCATPYFFAAQGHTLNTGTCASAPVEDITAIYQPFEQGFAIRRADTGEIVVFSLVGSQSLMYVVDTSGATAETPPSGLYAPGATFAGVWSGHLTYRLSNTSAWPDTTTISGRDALGWATAPEQTYTMRRQPDDPHPFGAEFRTMFFTVPDGRIVAADTYHWQFIN